MAEAYFEYCRRVRQWMVSVELNSDGRLHWSWSWSASWDRILEVVILRSDCVVHRAVGVRREYVCPWKLSGRIVKSVTLPSWDDVVCRTESGVACVTKSCLVSVRRYSVLRDDWVVLRTVILVSFRFAGPVFLSLFCRRVILCNFVHYVLLMHVISYCEIIVTVRYFHCGIFWLWDILSIVSYRWDSNFTYCKHCSGVSLPYYLLLNFT